MCPNSALVNLAAGWPLSYIGAYDEAVAAFEAGIRLDPLGDMAVYCRMGAAFCHVMAERVETGIDLAEQVVAEVPHYGTGLRFLLFAYWAAGRTEDAHRIASELRRIEPGLTLNDALESTPYRQPDQQQLMIDAFQGVGLLD